MLFACRSEGLSPYLIPYGGASSVGTWGYIEAFKELMEQVHVTQEATNPML